MTEEKSVTKEKPMTKGKNHDKRKFYLDRPDGPNLVPHDAAIDSPNNTIVDQRCLFGFDC